MDVLADIVEGLELRSSLYFRAELGTPFALAVPEDRRRIRFHLAGAGRSWVGLPGGEGLFYETGDLILVPHGGAHRLASAPVEAAPPLDDALRASPVADGVFRHGGPGATIQLVCGHFEFDERVVHPLVDSLPPLLHLEARSGPGFAWVAPLLQAIEREARMDAPAGASVARRLSEIFFIQVLRAVLAREGPAPGLLGLIRDPQLGRALQAIHAEPGADWSLDALASLAGASRSVFTERFRERLGIAPMRYLTDWRMKRARRLLADPGVSVGEVGRRVGYTSEAAFNRAFREVVGEPPGRHRRSVLQAACRTRGQELRTPGQSPRPARVIHPPERRAFRPREETR